MASFFTGNLAHVLVTCGAFTRQGDFLELPEFDMERLLIAWQEAVFELYLAEEKIEPEVVENMRSWEHSGLLRFTSQGLLVIYSDLPELGELNSLADVGIPMLRQSNIVTLVEASWDGFPGYTPTAEQPGFIVLAPFPSMTYDFIGNLPEPRVPMEPGAWLAIRFMSRPRWRRRQTNARRRRPATPWRPGFFRQR